MISANDIAVLVRQLKRTNGSPAFVLGVIGIAIPRRIPTDDIS